LGVLDTPCLVMVAPNGGRHSSQYHPRLPLTAQMLAEDAAACADAGAAALHFHVRDADGRHSLDPALYRAWLDRVEARAGGRVALQVTSEALGIYTAAEQLACIRALRPAAVSLALRELLPEGADPALVREFLGWLVAERISPQFILYAPEEVARLHELRRDGTIPQRSPFVLFVLGRYLAAGELSQPADLLPFLARHDPGCPWAVCAFGRSETAVLVAAAALGGHVRIGLENNRERADGTIAASNAERVATIVELVRALGRPVATTADALGLLSSAAR
jgi:3-keto-5-aminohexanoate cleavage enzyme